MGQETMPRRPLGKTGIDVTEIGTGLWAIGGHWGPTDDEAALGAIDAALDAGVNLFDTSDIHGNGHSEELLGRVMRGRRDRFVLATKNGWMEYDSERNRSAYDTIEKVAEGVEAALARLGTGHIDLIQDHVFCREPNTNIKFEAFQRLKEQGKVRANGVSTSDPEFIRELIQDWCCETVQIDHSILNRTSEGEIFPLCQERGVGVIVRGAMAMGILTGKLTAESRFPEGDFRRDWHEDLEQRKTFLRDLGKVERLRPLAKGKTLSQLALQFAQDHPAVSTVIPGARNPDQARQNTASGFLGPLTDEERAAIDAVTPSCGGRKIWPASETANPLAAHWEATVCALQSIRMRAVKSPAQALPAPPVPNGEWGMGNGERGRRPRFRPWWESAGGAATWPPPACV